MKLFISYSRDDKAWVYELWRALRDDTQHDAWIDRRIVPASDWWGSILQNIEVCECFIYVMTPKSVESIYCVAEMDYAIALNKPILPIMLKDCGFPATLGQKRVQYQLITDDMNMDKVLLKMSQGLTEVRIDILQDKYPPQVAIRPDVPKPQKKPEQISEVFRLAEEASAANNMLLAERLFRQVIETDPKNWGLAAAERLSEIKFDLEREQDYLNVVQMANNPSLTKGAKAAARIFIQKYGKEYDPRNIFDQLLAPTMGSVAASNQSQFIPHSTNPTSIELLPQPFGWIEIPNGEVCLVENYDDNSYLGKRGERKIVEVPFFLIAKYPITNGQFAKFVEANGYTERQWWTNEGWQAKEIEGWSAPRYWQDSKWNKGSFPVVGVSWYEAIAFCEWLSKATSQTITLPSEKQWQRAAQGNTNNTYPWGNQFDKFVCNTSSQGTTPVNKYQEKGNSPFEVSDMSGNVWEWCLTKYYSGGIETGGTEAHILRGGSWKVNEDAADVNCRIFNDPNARHPDYGFRIVLV